MKFGCCAPIRLYDEVVKAGYDYIDVNGADLYELSDEEFEDVQKKVSCGDIPCLALSGYAKTEPSAGIILQRAFFLTFLLSLLFIYKRENNGK